MISSIKYYNSSEYNGRSYIHKVDHLKKLLLDREFKFYPDKVNIIFGPNGSGKTTIMNSLAGYAGVIGAHTDLSSDITDVTNSIFDSEIDIKYYLSKRMINDNCDIDWDGAPVYYMNNSKIQKDLNVNNLDLVGNSVSSSTAEYLSLCMDKVKLSSGNLQILLINRYISLLSDRKSTKELLGEDWRRCSSWNNYRKISEVQYDYFSKFPKFDDKDAVRTLLIDESDSNIDIEVSYELISKVYPSIINKLNTQIIAVTHNPIVLSNKFMNNDKYNIISIDSRYNKDVLKLMHELFNA